MIVQGQNDGEGFWPGMRHLNSKVTLCPRSPLAAAEPTTPPVLLLGLLPATPMAAPAYWGGSAGPVHCPKLAGPHLALPPQEPGAEGRLGKLAHILARVGGMGCHGTLARPRLLSAVVAVSWPRSPGWPGLPGGAGQGGLWAGLF